MALDEKFDTGCVVGSYPTSKWKLDQQEDFGISDYTVNEFKGRIRVKGWVFTWKHPL